jgi:hypothetical protein
MPDNDTLIMLQSFIASRTRVIRKINVITDFDLSELFEAELYTIQDLTETHISRFKNDCLVILNPEERSRHQEARFAYTDQGIFILAGLIRSKRAIRIYVKLIELLVNRLQNKAYEIATTYQSAKI